MQSILIIEDEPKVANFIRQGLEEEGYSVKIAKDGLIGKTIALSEHFNLIILDINLPIINGYEVCSEIKKLKDIPVLMLTALGTTDDKVLGFNCGADDYLVKPFEFRELLARVRALLKRTIKFNERDILKVADLILDLNRKVAIRGGVEIELTAKEYSLLEFLMRNKERVVSRVDIAEKIWDITFDTGTNVIDVYINFLRRKIDKDFPVKLIHTQIGMGYVLKEK